jgi:acetyl-CoA synthetase
MVREYKSWEDFKNNYKLSDRWEFFDGNKTSFNIAHECLDRHPKDNTAVNIIRADGHHESYTFGQLSRLTSQFAYAMEKLGIEQGGRIILMMNPSLEFYVSFYGILRMGAVAVSCSPLFGPEAIEFRINKSNAKVAIVDDDAKDLIKPGVVERVITSGELIGLIEEEKEHYEPHTTVDSLAFMQFSSGTTGEPKSVDYRHRSVGIVAFRMKYFVGIRPNDIYLCPSSPAWGHGLWYGVIGPLVFGNATTTYSGKFSADTMVDGIEKFEISNMYATPLIYRRIMESGRLDNAKLKLRRLTYTGGALDMDIIRYFQEKTGLIIQVNFGSTETGGFLSDYAFDDWVPKPGSLGKPLPHVTVGILDENGLQLPPGKVGHIAVKFKKGAEWFKMGDTGYVDEDGYYWYKSRTDDVIISAGYTIGPIEVENVLLKHPAVREAAVVGSPDKDRGEIVKAFIVTDRDKSKREKLEEDIKNFVKTRLSRHEYPRAVEFVDSLPSTLDGKIKRKELKLREYERAKVKT